MVEQAPGAIWRLWQTSAPWRQSVIVAVIGGIILFSGLHPSPSGPDPSGPGPIPTPPRTPTPPPTQSLPQKLGFYRMAYQRIDGAGLGKGARCERISVAFDEVPPDLQTSTDDRVKLELDGGRSCQNLLAKSDGHFTSFSTAVTQADVASDRAAIDAVTSAMRAFDDFDKTRSGFVATRTKADKFIAMVQKADKEFAELQRALDQTGAGGGSGAQQGLLQALGAIPPVDESLATPGQKDLLAKARTAASLFAAAELSAAVKALNGDHSLANYQKVVALYRTVKTAKPEATPVEPSVLEAAKTAESELTSSDDRLKVLAGAAEDWRKHHDASICSALTKASDALLALDRARLTQSGQSELEAAANGARRQIQADDLILHGPKYWGDFKERRRVPIFFQSEKKSVSLIVADNINRTGYKIASDVSSASLIFNIILEGPNRCDGEGNGQEQMYCSKISIIDANWVCGDQLNFPSSGDGQNVNAEASVYDAIDKFTNIFEHNAARETR